VKFSICIPNYNYEQFVGRTIESVLSQTNPNWELVVADNSSTDDSVKVIESFEDERIRFKVNNCNVGFAGNLDQVGRMATGDLMIMLSSDDLMREPALQVYKSLFEALGGQNTRAIICSTMDKIDADDNIIGNISARPILWNENDLDPELGQMTNSAVYRVDAKDMLRRCLETMQNPFNFASTCYPAGLYHELEGYGGGRLICPDKWFHWRLLDIADVAIFVDRPLFAYRWHASNQTAQQKETGALKYQVDDYRATLEIEDATLHNIKMDRRQLIEAFIEYDIARSGLATLASGAATRARRILRFGESVYPEATKQNKKALALNALLALGPIGQEAASLAYKRLPEAHKTNPQPKDFMPTSSV
jgi:glycosyltransferase involved in cell wall biosynthesis